MGISHSGHFRIKTTSQQCQNCNLAVSSLKNKTTLLSRPIYNSPTVGVNSEVPLQTVFVLADRCWQILPGKRDTKITTGPELGFNLCNQYFQAIRKCLTTKYSDTNILCANDTKLTIYKRLLELHEEHWVRQQLDDSEGPTLVLELKHDKQINHVYTIHIGL